MCVYFLVHARQAQSLTTWILSTRPVTLHPAHRLIWKKHIQGGPHFTPLKQQSADRRPTVYTSSLKLTANAPELFTPKRKLYRIPTINFQVRCLLVPGMVVTRLPQFAVYCWPVWFLLNPQNLWLPHDWVGPSTVSSPSHGLWTLQEAFSNGL